MKLDEMGIFNISMVIDEAIWLSAIEWENFAKYSFCHYKSQSITVNHNKSL